MKTNQYSGTDFFPKKNFSFGPIMSLQILRHKVFHHKNAQKAIPLFAVCIQIRESASFFIIKY